MTMRKKLERFSEVSIFNEMDGFVLDFVEVENAERGFRSTTPDIGAATLDKDEFGICK